MSKPSDFLAGPWFAYLLDEDGFAYDSVRNVEANGDLEGEFQVAIVRRSATPKDGTGMHRIPRTTVPGDIIWIREEELPLEADDQNDRAVSHLIRAHAMAAGLNAASAA